MQRVVCLAGRRGSGTTTLVTAVLPALRAAGLRRAALEHAHHELEMDRPGTDGLGARGAGAIQVLVASRQ